MFHHRIRIVVVVTVLITGDPISIKQISAKQRYADKRAAVANNNQPDVINAIMLFTILSICSNLWHIKDNSGNN
jgi:hypothetical protein